MIENFRLTENLKRVGLYDIDFSSKLGSGHFSTVYKAIQRPTSPQKKRSEKIVACKVITRAQLDRTEKEYLEKEL